MLETEVFTDAFCIELWNCVEFILQVFLELFVFKVYLFEHFAGVFFPIFVDEFSDDSESTFTKSSSDFVAATAWTSDGLYLCDLWLH